MRNVLMCGTEVTGGLSLSRIYPQRIRWTEDLDSLGADFFTMIDSHDLSAAEAAELERLLDSARFFELPEDSRALRRGAADYQQYTITVEHRKRHHTVRLADPVESPDIEVLLDFLRSATERPAMLEGAPAPEQRMRKPKDCA